MFGKKKNDELLRRVAELEDELKSVRVLYEATIAKQREELAGLRNFALDARLHLQNILSELKESKRDGREVSASRIRREIKKVLRWYYDQTALH